MLKALSLSVVVFALIGCATDNRHRVAQEDYDGAPIDTEITKADMVKSAEYGEING